jgi:adenylate kinase
MQKIAIVLYGRPGSGKGTQAALLGREMNLVQYDIGSAIEAVVHDPKNRRNKSISRQRELFDSGELCDSAWVVKLVSGDIARIARAGLGVIFSGSLRTMTETFGDKGPGLLSVLERAYGKKNTHFFLLDVSEAESLRRNTGRLICSVCGRPVLHSYVKAKPTGCPLCGGALKKRVLDKPSIIKKRLAVFRAETEPVFAALKDRGYAIHRISARGAPYQVFKKLVKAVYDLC